MTPGAAFSAASALRGTTGGDFEADTWHRIAVTIDPETIPVTYVVLGHIDGEYTTWSTTSSPPDGKESVDEFLHLFTQYGGLTAAGMVNSVAFYDEVLTEEAIGLLGGASASGIPVSAPPTLNADFDEDNVVDGQDFLIWQRGFGIGSGATHGQGDADEDAAVNAADLAVWQTQFGGPPPLDCSRGGCSRTHGIGAVTPFPAGHCRDPQVLL